MKASPSNRALVGGQSRGEAQIIILPARLRLQWLEAIAADKELSNLTCRIALIIGAHFNRDSGTSWPSKRTLASIVGVDKKTIWRAVTNLEQRGYLIVRRRDLGARADGRRVAGGKGSSNEYLPAFAGSRISAIENGQRLAAFCREQLTQRRAQAPSSAETKEGTGALLSDQQSRAFLSPKEGIAAPSQPVSEPEKETRAGARGPKPGSAADTKMPSVGGAAAPDRNHTTLRIHSAPEPESAKLEGLLAKLGRALGSHVVRIYLRPAKPELLDGRLVLHAPPPREFDWYQRNESELNKAAGIEVVILREKKR